MKQWIYLLTSFLILNFPTLLNSQHFLEYQDSAHIDHIFDQTAFLGGGAVFFDYDNDGDEDLYITAGNERDHFYENNGDGTFTYKSIEAGFVITKLYYTIGAIAGDIDNDGFKDLFITTWFADFEPMGKNLLYKNNGDGTFTEIWTQQEEKDKTQTMGATFIDYDLDGLLDIYTVSYVEDVGFIYDNDGNIIGFDHTCYQNRLYHNLGDGNFEEKAATLNVHDNGCALAVTASDFDLDQDMDIYIANDFGEFIKPNGLYQFNSDNGFFWNVGEAFNADVKMYGMGIAVGDVDNDLDLDYYITNYGKNVLLKNDGNIFSDISDQSGTGDEWTVEDSLMAVGWGTVFLDIDNDTDLDLYVGNGYVPSPNFINSSIYQKDKLFLNNGNLEFSDVSLEYGIENNFTTRGVTFSDYDNDGDLDILAVVENVPVNNFNWATILYNNQLGNEKNWLQVSLEGVEVNRDAFGSKIYLYTEGKTFIQEISGGSSHASQISSRAHFGLGDAVNIDSLQIVWTGGERMQTIYDIEANQHIYVIEDTTTINVVNNIELAADSPTVHISPNPSGGEINILLDNFTKFEKGEIDILNSMGKKVRRLNFNSSNKRINIDLSDLPNGVYFISAQMGESLIAEKVILQK